MATYFIADTHFGHRGIVKFCNRPFDDVEEMDRTLKSNWNARVTPDDTVYIVGDLYMGGYFNKGIELINSLNGKKHLIAGNHDLKYLTDENYRKLFVSISDILNIIVDGKKVVLCHYPLAEWEDKFGGAWHVYGHVHNHKNDAYAFMSNQERGLNAGVDIINYMPVLFEELVVYNQMFKELC